MLHCHFCLKSLKLMGANTASCNFCGERPTVYYGCSDNHAGLTSGLCIPCYSHFEPKNLNMRQADFVRFGVRHNQNQPFEKSFIPKFMENPEIIYTQPDLFTEDGQKMFLMMERFEEKLAFDGNNAKDENVRTAFKAARDAKERILAVSGAPAANGGRIIDTVNNGARAVERVADSGARAVERAAASGARAVDPIEDLRAEIVDLKRRLDKLEAENAALKQSNKRKRGD